MLGQPCVPGALTTLKDWDLSPVTSAQTLEQASNSPKAPTQSVPIVTLSDADTGVPGAGRQAGRDSADSSTCHMPAQLLPPTQSTAQPCLRHLVITCGVGSH